MYNKLPLHHDSDPSSKPYNTASNLPPSLSPPPQPSKMSNPALFRTLTSSLLRPPTRPALLPLQHRYFLIPHLSLNLKTDPSSTTTTSSTPAIQTTSAEAYNILVAQRRNRPIAPHLSIYKPQITWYGSAANRVTGVLLSGSIYAYFAAYAAAPLLGWHGLDTASLAAVFGSFPVAVKVMVKAGVALPFCYHSWNGLRHLAWDSANFLDIKDVYRTMYAVLAATAASTVWLALI